MSIVPTTVDLTLTWTLTLAIIIIICVLSPVFVAQKYIDLKMSTSETAVMARVDSTAVEVAEKAKREIQVNLDFEIEKLKADRVSSLEAVTNQVSN